VIHRINDSIEDHIEWDLYNFVSAFWAGNLFLNWKGDFLREKIDCTKSRLGGVQTLSDPVLTIQFW
jgi:hypothetical protein